MLACVLPLLVGGGAHAQGSSGWLAYGNDAARTSFTDTSLSPPSVKPAWYTPILGRVSSQALVAQDVPGPGLKTVYVATSRGMVYALAENGYVRWRVDLGQLERVCQQIDGYGVTGTPAIDLASRTLYVADAFGRVHALDLATGAERAGWPVTVYSDFRRGARLGRAHDRERLRLPRHRFVLRPEDDRKGVPGRPRHQSRVALDRGALAPRRGRQRLGLGRSRVQRLARLALRRDRQRVRGGHELGQALPRVRRPRGAARRARTRPFRARGESPARHPQEAGPRLRRLARPLSPPGLRSGWPAR